VIRRPADMPLLKLLSGMALRDGQVVHVETLSARGATFQDPAAVLPPALQDRLEDQGISRLYSHQAEALDRVRARENVVAVTGTASGKTLCYNLPVIERLLADSKARALYLFPTKALAQDQLKGLKRFLAEDDRPEESPLFRAGTYDGDTPGSLRARLRDEANILLTNPDMLHSGILPHHPRWAEFFHRLEYIVIDEIHVYRGIFGSHVANVLRRLRRICRHHGSNPVWICASATIANPRELAEQLTGLPFAVVDRDGAPRGTKHFLFWNPPRVGPAGMERRSANTEAKEVFLGLLREGYSAITFVKTRMMTEVLLRYCQDELRHEGGGLVKKIRSYRAGYLPEERRKIEAALFEGELLGVISTNALELGIDVGSLDAAILVGYPGTISSTWQQAGRAGRREEESAAILLAHNAPIDQYLMGNPEYFFARNPECAILDPANPHILLSHLRCATFEIPIRREEEVGFGEYAPAILDLLQEREHLREVKGQWFYTRGDYPAAGVSLRNAGDNVYTIIDTTASGGSPGAVDVGGAGLEAARAGRARDAARNRVIGTVDELSAFSQVHPQAVYMHEGETYFVDRLDLVEKAAYIHKADLDYYTQSISDNYIDAEQAEQEKLWRGSEVSFGECSVHDKMTMFKKIKFGGRDSLGYGTIDLPHTTLHTVALWLVPPAEALNKVVQWGRVPADGLQGIANVLSEVISLYAMCDPLDLGTLVELRTAVGPTLYVWDKYPGGLGYALRAWHLCEEVMQSALKLIRGCDCEDGCPSCVGSPILPQYPQDPDAVTKGRIPDKEAALILLHALLELPDYEPRVPLSGERALRAQALLAATAHAPRESGDGAPASAGGAGAETKRSARAGREARRARSEASLPPRDIRPLPPDLRRKLEGQIEQIAKQAQPRGRRGENPVTR
jgi:DEAD/DEAH box helicase domain-containing protein